MGKFTFHFTVEETNTILASLGKQPYQDVAELINAIVKQYQDQLPTQETEEEWPQPKNIKK